MIPSAEVLSFRNSSETGRAATQAWSLVSLGVLQDCSIEIIGLVGVVQYHDGEDVYQEGAGNIHSVFSDIQFGLRAWILRRCAFWGGRLRANA